VKNEEPRHIREAGARQSSEQVTAGFRLSEKLF